MCIRRIRYLIECFEELAYGIGDGGLGRILGCVLGGHFKHDRFASREIWTSYETDMEILFSVLMRRCGEGKKD